jgi:hypothetical protein
MDYVVGSGPQVSPAAHDLAKAGRQVTILDWGTEIEAKLEGIPTETSRRVVELPSRKFPRHHPQKRRTAVKADQRLRLSLSTARWSAHYSLL